MPDSQSSTKVMFHQKSSNFK